MFFSKTNKFILINMVVLLFLSLGFGSVLAADWSATSTGDIQSLRSITKSGDNLIAVGNGGKVLLSTDGASWSEPIPQSGSWFFKVGKQVSGDLLATGQGGLFITSSDNGLTWSQVSYGITKDIFDFEAKGESGYMAGSAGTFLYYDLNSDIWRSRSVGLTTDLYGAHDMGDDSSGWVVGNSGKIIKLSQRGISYGEVASGTNETLYDVLFTSDSVGFIVGTMGTVLKTVDSGVTWTKQTIPNLDNQALYSIDASGNNLAIAGDTVLLVSEDLGATWDVQDYSGTLNTFRDVYFENETTIWAVGTEYNATSLIYKYEIAPVVVIPPVVDDIPEVVPPEAQPGSLVKLACQAGAQVNDPCKAVYFYATDGKRHAFPNDKVFFTWFDNFDSVKEVSAEFMSSLTLGKNVTYHPGTKMVKFQTVDTVYAVSKMGVLRAIGTEAVAEALYGTDWNKKIDDISDVFITNYTFGTKVEAAVDYSVDLSKISVTSLNDNY